ncbi:MFS transporter [Ferruginibacter sp.]
MDNTAVKKWILPVIVIAQFLCTSLWFAGNAVIPDIVSNIAATPGILANITSAVQLGFIAGTLMFALLTIADRFSPSVVFFVCSLIAAAFNLGMIIPGISVNSIMLLRFFTGFFLAGIYPVGMKIASDYFQKGLVRSLGFLVGALVFGTSLPHLLKTFTTHLPWRYVIDTISALSVSGGLLLLLLVKDGPYRKKGQALKFRALLGGFSNAGFRSAALGYFGHMWELYAFWAFVPVMLTVNKEQHHNNLNVSLFSFWIIALGGIACMVSGVLSQRWGTKRIAAIALFLSGSCCIVSPLFLFSSNTTLLIGFLFFWGWMVIADSPLFSALVAQNVPEHSRGTLITMVTCIGFAITIISIQLIKMLSATISPQYIYLLLAIGPVLGLTALLQKNKTAE